MDFHFTTVSVSGFLDQGHNHYLQLFFIMLLLASSPVPDFLLWSFFSYCNLTFFLSLRVPNLLSIHFFTCVFYQFHMQCCQTVGKFFTYYVSVFCSESAVSDIKGDFGNSEMSLPHSGTWRL
jgi:hypothetical protein